jgi:O-antigen/teichoic acid export membrane protein
MQIVTIADLLIVGGFRNVSDAGAYKLGAATTAMAAALLFQGYDVALPSFSAHLTSTQQEQITRLLTRVFGVFGGALFGLILFDRTKIVIILLGHSSSVAETTLAFFSLVWLANTCIHGWVLLLIAKGRQKSILWLVVGETASNIAATIILVSLIGPIGAATASLIVVIVSNLLILPHLLRQSFPSFSPGSFLGGVLPAIGGLAVAGAISLITLPIHWRTLALTIQLALSLPGTILLIRRVAGPEGSAILKTMLARETSRVTSGDDNSEPKNSPEGQRVQCSIG